MHKLQVWAFFPTVTLFSFDPNLHKIWVFKVEIDSVPNWIAFALL